MGTEPGAVVDVASCAELGRSWYRTRLEHDWEPHTPGAMAAMFRDVGLTEPFWDVGA